jgi:hypothetical protein
VTGKTVASQKQSALIDWRRGNGVDAAGSTQFDRCFDIAGGGAAGGARFDSGLDVSADVVEVKNYRLGDVIGKALVAADDCIATLQIQRSRVVRQQLRIANDYRAANGADFFFGDCLEHHLRPDPGGISHGDAYARTVAVRIILRTIWSQTSHQ